MPELRWILLLVGVLFIVALAVWEVRRSRHAQSDKSIESERPPPAREPGNSNSRVQREPSLTLPEVRSREPARESPDMDADDDSTVGLRIDGRRIEEEEAEAEPSAPEPIVPDPPTLRAAPLPPSQPTLPQEPIVDWPPEGSRRIVALRLVAPSGERFLGRIMRQALSAEGFALGKFSIFHKPGPDGRAIISAASLTKPGTFELDVMDGQRFTGLSLFTVLPGPLPDVEAFEDLITTARRLSDRLRGTLQDGRGGPLTLERISEIRESLTQTSSEHSTSPSEPTS